MCSYIAQNARWITGVLSNDIAAILPCTKLYVQSKCSHTLHVQYTRVSNCFFNTTLYCKTAYYTWEKWVQCAFVVFLREKWVEWHLLCSYIAQNARWITGVLSDDNAAILPCTALYLQPKYSWTVCFQYTRVSRCFSTIILYCKQVYFT